MKVQVDIITGFLGSGKTTFINGMLESLNTKDRIVIIQCESGETQVDDNLFDKRNIYLKSLNNEEDLTSAYISQIIKKYLPHRIIIEHNGMSTLEDLLLTLDEGKVRKNSVVNKVVHMIDMSTFEMFMNNMGSILIEQITNSDLIVLNRFDNLPKDKLNSTERSIKSLNKSAEIMTSVLKDESEMTEIDKRVISDFDEPRKSWKSSDTLFGVFIGLAVIYLLFSVARSVNITSTNLAGLQIFNTVFLSILIQAFPFILIGVFVSSIIQVFVSEQTIIKVFPKNKVLAYIVAILSGFLFPVCDCAIVPVAARLAKKGVPLSAAITFMLSAPLVNPIVIASTFYAFPDQPHIAFFRVYLGVTLALAVGLAVSFLQDKRPVLLNDIDNFICKCGYCSDNKKKGITGKVNAILKHAGAEFFEVGRFLVIGAFLSSTMQTIIPREVLGKFGAGSVIPLLIMMACAFVLSVCSTSDAFIARSFVNQFSMSSVMGFMVLGPMIDVKNTLMLLGSFRKRFVIKLLMLIFGLSFVLLFFFSIFY